MNPAQALLDHARTHAGRGDDCGRLARDVIYILKAMGMDTFVQPKLTGYRQLSADEAALMNEGKALAEMCGIFIDKLRLHDEALKDLAATPLVDQRWVSIGATQLQQGWMAVIRGIAKPESF